MADANIKAVITAEDKASSTLRNFSSHVESVGGKVLDVAKAAAVGLAAAGAASVAFGLSSVKAFNESQDAIAQTNAVLKSTAGVAGVTAEQVDKLSKSLQAQTKYSDEEVRSAENMLLTFTSIGKDIFPQATKTVLDMSTALGQDLKSSSIQLGKALQDPIRGVTALRRVGVNFSEKQQDVIKSLVETGKTAEAQKLILKELNTEFGGSAEAAGKTFSGSLAKLKNQLNDIQETIGKVIVDGLTPLTGKIAEFLSKIDWDKAIEKAKQGLKGFVEALKGNGVTSDGFVGKMEKVGASLRDFYDKAKQVAGVVAEYLEPKFTALWHTLDEKVFPTLKRLWKEVIEPLIPVIGETLVGAFGALLDAVNALLNIADGIVNWMLDNKTATLGLAAAFGTLALAMNLSNIVTAFQASMAAVQASIAATQATIASPTVMGGIAVAGALADLALVKEALNDIKRAASDVQDAANAAANLAPEAQMRQLQRQAAEARARGDTAAAKRYSNAIAALGGGRAGGGPVQAGIPYLVGEKGPEIVIPNRNSTVVPNDKSVQMMGGQTTVNINVNAGIFMGTDVEARKTANYILEHLRDLAAQKNTTVAQMMGM